MVITYVSKPNIGQCIAYVSNNNNIVFKFLIFLANQVDVMIINQIYKCNRNPSLKYAIIIMLIDQCKKCYLSNNNNDNNIA